MQLAVDRVGQSVINIQSKLQKNSTYTGKSLDQLNEKLALQKGARGAATSIHQIMRLNGAIRQTEKEIRRLENLPPMSFIDRLRQAGSQMGAIVGIAGGLAIVTAGWGAIKNIANLGMEAEQTRIRFGVMLGDAQKANAMIADITNYAIATPFASADLKQAGELLLNFGITGDKVMPTLKMLGDVSGGNKDRLQGMTLAFSQMASTGRLMGQDLNQMINAGFNPLQAIAENTGIALGELKKQMEAGKISVEMVEEAFKLATGPGGRFHGMLDKISKSARAQLGSAMESIAAKLTNFGETHLVPIIAKLAGMAEKFFNSLDTIGAALQPFFNTLKPLWDAIVGFTDSFFGLDKKTDGTTGVINFLTNSLNVLGFVFSWLSNGIRVFLNFISPLAPLIKWLAIVWGGLNVVVAIFNALVSANPIGRIIAAIVILIGLIVTCWQRFATFRAVVMGAWEAIKGFGTMIKDYVINRFKELLSGITGIGEALLHFFKGDWGKAWDAGKKAAGNLMGLGSAAQLIEDGKKVAGKVGQAYNAEFIKKQTPKVAAAAKPGQNAANAAKPSKQKESKLFASLHQDTGKATKDGQATGGGGKSTSQGIIGGGSKMTTINISLQKMQDQIVINTVSAGEGATKLRQILEEELNRLLGSVAAMQTA